ncbi:hypothetical protein [Colwellia sp. MEBiC06753]
MAQTLKSLTYEDVKLFCEQSLQADLPVTLERLLAEFPEDSIDVVAYFHQWRQDRMSQSLATSSQSSENKPVIPPSITQILQEEIAKLQASQAKEQQTLLAQQQDIEQFLIAKSQELQANLDSQSKFADETKQQLDQQSLQFQEQLHQVINDHGNEIEALKQQHQQSLIAQQQEHQSAIEIVINENAAQLASLSEQVTTLIESNTLLEAQAEQYLASQQQLGELQSTITQLEQQLAEEKTQQAQYIEAAKKQYQGNLNTLRETQQQELVELQSTITQLEQQLAEEKLDQEHDIAAAKKQYQENLNTLRDAHQQEINELTGAHQNDIAQQLSHSVQPSDDSREQLSKIQQENQILEQQLAQEQSKSAQLQTRLVNVSNDANKDKETNIKLVALLEKANTKTTTLEQQLSQQKTGLTLESDLNALEKAERMITVLRSENTKLANQLDLIKTNSISTIERLTDKSDQAMTRIKELESQLSLEVSANSSVKEERAKLKEQLELMRHNQVSTFERLTNNVEKANAKIKALEQQLAEVKS